MVIVDVKEAVKRPRDGNLNIMQLRVASDASLLVASNASLRVASNASLLVASNALRMRKSDHENAWVSK